MSSLFGVGPSREDRDLAEAARRRRLAFARDIGDEKALARDAVATRRRRGFGWVALAVVALALVGAVPLFRNAGGLVPVDCEQPAVGLAESTAHPGAQLAWQVTGPRGGDYAVTVDGDAVTADATGRLASHGGTLVAGPFRLDDCRSSQALLSVPPTAGAHTVALFHRTGASFDRVATAPLQVG